MKKEDIYLEIIQAGEEDQNDLKIEILELLNSNLFELIQSLKDGNVKLKYFQNELEGKYFRFGIANQSIINLSKGNLSTIFDKEVNILDVFSVFSIARMQIEAFTMMYYLFFDNISENELKMRYDVYKIHGLSKQSKFKAKSEHSKIKRDNILTELELTRNSLSKNPLFISLEIKEKENRLNPNYAKLVKSDEIMKKSGLTKIDYYSIWSLYSNHIHGEYISDRQYNAMFKNQKGVAKEVGVSLTLIITITARLCNFLCSEFNDAQKKLDSFSERRKIHQRIWSGLVE